MTVDPLEFLEAAVQIPSNESVSEMREFLISTLEDHGHDARIDDAGNTLATRGTGSRHVVLNTHIDTVSPHVAFSRTEETIRGRGSCDAKGPLAALLAAFLAVEPTDGRVTLAVTPDEEARSLGAAALDLDGDAYIVGEPTGLAVCTAARGRFQGTITLTGESAHAAEPASGVNSIRAVRDVLDALETFDEQADAPPVHPELGGPTLTPTTIRGGESTNQLPATTSIVLDRRTVPPETAPEFQQRLTDHLLESVSESVGVSFELTDRESPFLDAWDTPVEEPLVEALASASGGPTRPFTAASEASYFAADAPTVVFGPGELADEQGAVAHSEREYVPLEAVTDARDALTTTLRTLFGAN